MRSALVTFVSLLTLIVTFASPAGALAGKPTFFEEVWDSTEIITDFCGVPGLTVEAQFTGSLSGQIRFDKGPFPFFSTHVTFLDTWTGPNGKVVTVSAVRNEKDAEIVDNGDGTIAIHIKSTGASVTIIGPDGERAIDRGLVVFVITVDYNGTPGDPSDDVFASFDGIDKMAGPHPDITEPGGTFCPIAVPAFTS